MGCPPGDVDSCVTSQSGDEFCEGGQRDATEGEGMSDGWEWGQEHRELVPLGQRWRGKNPQTPVKASNRPVVSRDNENRTRDAGGCTPPRTWATRSQAAVRTNAPARCEAGASGTLRQAAWRTAKFGHRRHRMGGVGNDRPQSGGDGWRAIRQVCSYIVQCPSRRSTFDGLGTSSKLTW